MKDDMDQTYRNSPRPEQIDAAMKERTEKFYKDTSVLRWTYDNAGKIGKYVMMGIVAILVMLLFLPLVMNLVGVE